MNKTSAKAGDWVGVAVQGGASLPSVRPRRLTLMLFGVFVPLSFPLGVTIMFDALYYHHYIMFVGSVSQRRE